MSDERGSEVSVTEYTHDEKGKRVDVHRPSAINPGDYEYTGVSEARKALKEGQKIAGPGGTCHHCGKAIVWRVHFKHLPTSNIVTFGHICAGILEMTDNRIDHEMNLLKRQAENERREEQWAQQKIDRFEAFRRDHADLANFLDEWDTDDEPNGYIARIKWGVEKYGSPLDTMIPGLRRFKEGRERFVAQRLEEAKTLENAPKLESGRQVIEGHILKAEYKDSGYGVQWKGTICMLDGNRVYGTIPAAIEREIEGTPDMKDRKIRFSANVDAKEDHFGFFSRPTKPEVL
jgi:hypothetical protein